MNTTDDDATVIRASLVEPEDFGVLFDRHAPAIQYLRRNADGTPGHPNSIGKYVMRLAQTMMPPKSRAALFEASAKLPGLFMVRSAVDGAGRPGIGVAWSTMDGYGDMIVFDASTHAYLGTKDSAVLSTAVVDTAGQH